jgi:aminoglycoside 3-N-acetyltransferase
MITTADVSRFVDENGLSGSIVCLHSSFKSFGGAEGGFDAIIDGFSSRDATLVCPAFYYQSVTYPDRENYARNGIDYAKEKNLPCVDYVDSPEQIEPCMGAIPRALVRRGDAIRTRNPLNAFVVRGRHAAALTKDQSLLNAYSIYKNIRAMTVPSFIVLAGVGFTSCTPIHYAEELAGKGLFRRWAVYHGQTAEVEVGSCSDGFEKLRPFVGDVEKTARLGESPVRIYDFGKFIELVTRVIAERPIVAHCDNPACIRCDDMAAGGRLPS